MSRFEIELDTAGVRESLKDLERDWSSDRVYTVGTNQEYAVYLEFGRGPVSAGDNIRGLGTPGPQIPGGISGDEAQALRFKDEDGNIIYRASVSGHPPYPFFWPAVVEYEADPENFIRKNSGFKNIEQIPNGDTLVKTIAQALESQMSDNASADTASGRSPGTHPDHPVRDSGTLVASISAVRVR